jgi:hypothetical protein
MRVLHDEHDVTTQVVSCTRTSAPKCAPISASSRLPSTYRANRRPRVAPNRAHHRDCRVLPWSRGLDHDDDRDHDVDRESRATRWHRRSSDSATGLETRTANARIRGHDRMGQKDRRVPVDVSHGVHSAAAIRDRRSHGPGRMACGRSGTRLHPSRGDTLSTQVRFARDVALQEHVTSRIVLGGGLWRTRHVRCSEPGSIFQRRGSSSSLRGGPEICACRRNR